MRMYTPYIYILIFSSSLLTMSSNEALMFGVINLVGNFGTVFVDQSYWQNAVAAEPTATVGR